MPTSFKRGDIIEHTRRKAIGVVVDILSPYEIHVNWISAAPADNFRECHPDYDFNGNEVNFEKVAHADCE